MEVILVAQVVSAMQLIECRPMCQSSALRQLSGNERQAELSREWVPAHPRNESALRWSSALYLLYVSHNFPRRLSTKFFAPTDPSPQMEHSARYQLANLSLRFKRSFYG